MMLCYILQMAFILSFWSRMWGCLSAPLHPCWRPSPASLCPCFVGLALLQYLLSAAGWLVPGVVASLCFYIFVLFALSLALCETVAGQLGAVVPAPLASLLALTYLKLNFVPKFGGLAS